MADEKANNKEITNFKKTRVKEIQAMYSDEMSRRRGYDETPHYNTLEFKKASDIRKALNESISDKNSVVEASRKLYNINPIYASVINYLSNMFMWRYTVIPHKIWTSSKTKTRKNLPIKDYKSMYNLMLEVAEGLSIETKFPAMLTNLFVEGGVFFTTLSNEDSLTIDTLLLPNKYCRKVAETQYGTAIIEFDFSYFSDIALPDDKLKDFFKGWPEDFKKAYNRYKKDSRNMRWQELDPRFSSGIMLNELGIPTFLYVLGGILDYEQYQDNELERNENLLKYLVVQTMPHFEDNLIFEADEVKELHRSIKKIVDVGNKARLITTYGEVHVDRISENDTSENEVLSKAFKSIFNNAGFNSGIFTGESVEALKMSLIRDKGMIWKYVQQLLAFYNLTINNWYDFKGYQADIDILPISSYTYNDDIETYRQDATLGINKLGYIVASGIKQKHIQDVFDLENMLDLSQITPLQTSYTQTAADRAGETSNNKESNDSNTSSSKSVIEPSEKEKDQESTDSQDTVEDK